MDLSDSQEMQGNLHIVLRIQGNTIIGGRQEGTPCLDFNDRDPALAQQRLQNPEAGPK